MCNIVCIICIILILTLAVKIEIKICLLGQLLGSTSKKKMQNEKEFILSEKLHEIRKLHRKRY